MDFTPVPLVGHTVLLEPLAREHFAAVTAAALSAPEVWTHIPYAMSDPGQVERVLAQALDLQSRGAAVSFVTRLAASGEIAGGTSIRVVDRTLPSVEIGGTWVLPAWQRTAVNSEAKLLMLSHCFERLGCERVELKTDIRNTRSQAAIGRLGATREGVLRAHMRRVDGSARDSVLFSIIAGEWPALRERLELRLAAG